MKNYKIIDTQRLYENLDKFSDKKICAMVKSNAYGHGLKEIVKLVEDKVEYFGVVNVDEALQVRSLTDKPILICSKCFDLKTCKRKNFEIMVDDEIDLENCLKHGLKNACHLKINSGMNRFGVKSELNIRMMNNFMEEHDFVLKSIYTHFHCADNKKKTEKDYQEFLRMKVEISQNPPICFGGSDLINYPFEFDMLRLGIGMYGYGEKSLLPVMKLQSHVIKVFHSVSGEYIGYGKKFRLKKESVVAVVPVGYGDGMRRNLSGKIDVEINGKKFPCFGNICMDALFVLVDESVKVGDVVTIMSNADEMAKKLHTISYEILTGFSNFRGKTIIK